MNTSKLSTDLVDPPVTDRVKIFPESSFFKKRRASTPAEVRAINEKSGNIRATSFNRPSPVIISSLRLFVKYGADVTIVEAQTQMVAREQLQGQVPIPEVFGWAENGKQRFIYMSLIKGDMMRDRWGEMDEDERLAVCGELKHMAKAWRALKQDGLDRYIGSLTKKSLNEIFLRSHPEFTGPFQGANAVQEFQDACRIYINGEDSIVFTHDDLVPVNILLSPGPNPTVAAVIDWGQAGWYPAYWEYCKARQVRLDPDYFSYALQEEWWTKYLPLILDPMDDETYYHPFLYSVLSNGIC